MNTNHNFYPAATGGKWHAGSYAGGEMEYNAICKGTIELGDSGILSDRLTYTIEQLTNGKVHPIVCRRCVNAIISSKVGTKV